MDATLTFPATPSRDARRILLISIWFGLVCGLIEGVELLVLQGLGWINWNDMVWVSSEIIWVSPITDVALFVGVGLVLALAQRLFVRLRDPRIAIFTFGLLTIYDWLSIAGSGRIHRYAILSLSLGLVAVLSLRLNPSRFNSVVRRTLPVFAVLFVILFIGIQSGIQLQGGGSKNSAAGSSQALPNVLLVIVDTLRADHVSGYGYPRPTTPGIDRIAREGVLFENAFATSSWTLPSHTSLLTGRYPFEHEAATHTRYFDGDYPLLSQHLRDQGYRTAGFSANPTYFNRAVGLGRGFSHFEDHFWSIADAWIRTGFGRETNFWLAKMKLLRALPRKSASHVSRSVLDWVEEADDRPFFVAINFIEAHAPYTSPEPFRHRFWTTGQPDTDVLEDNVKRLSRDELQAQVDAYDGAVAYIDSEIEHVVQQLRSNPRFANTLVVITSDHGESFGEHGLMRHRYALYRECIRVPLVFWWPQKVPAGIRVEQVVSHVALPATILDLVGMGHQEVFPGDPLTLLWDDQKDDSWPFAMSELDPMPPELGKRAPAFDGYSVSVVDNRWHYISHAKRGQEIFDWRKDPQELTDLSDTPEGRMAMKVFADYVKQLPRDRR
jgi:arylsulfatase A-like enzyme